MENLNTLILYIICAQWILLDFVITYLIRAKSKHNEKLREEFVTGRISKASEHFLIDNDKIKILYDKDVMQQLEQKFVLYLRSRLH